MFYSKFNTCVFYKIMFRKFDTLNAIARNCFYDILKGMLLLLTKRI